MIGALLAGIPAALAANCDGGTVAQMTTMDTVVYTCPGDMMPDTVWFTHTTTSNDPYVYVITDANGTILGLPGSNFADFAPHG